MTITADTKPTIDVDNPKSLYQRYVQAAIVRSIASFVMWLAALIAYLLSIIHITNLICCSIAVSYLILINPPTLWILKRINNYRLSEFFAYFISLLEVIGFTAIIHSFGGIEGAFLLPLYTAAIAYVGPLEPRKTPFIIAGLSNICFCLLLILEHLGILQTLQVNPNYYMPWPYQIAIMCVEVPLLFVVAFISSYTAELLKKNREKLRLALIKVSESDRLKSEFLANISHEIRTPLHAIIGFSDLLNDQHLGELNEKQKDSVKDINTSGKHLLSIINDLLDFSKIEAGKMELNISETNLKTLIKNSLSMFSQIVQKRGIQLISKLDDCPEKIMVDDRMIKQILYNLLSNAIKFTSEGGFINLSVRNLNRINNYWLTKNGEVVYLPTFNHHDRMKHERIVEISVADTGIGLKKEDMGLIFKPFVQVDGSKSRRHEGTGLGLSITKQFVELHNGSIWAESEGENKGCTFHFVIPA